MSWRASWCSPRPASLALGAVTYAEQRSFLEGRIDQAVRSAIPAVSQALDDAGFTPQGDSSDGQSPNSGAGHRGPGGGRT